MLQQVVTENGDGAQSGKSGAGEAPAVVPKLEKRVTIDSNVSYLVPEAENRRVSEDGEGEGRKSKPAPEPYIKVTNADEETDESYAPQSPKRVHRRTCWPGDPKAPQQPPDQLSKLQLPKNMSKPEFKNFLLRVMRKNESNLNETIPMNSTLDWDRSQREESLRNTRQQTGSAQKPWLPPGAASTRLPSSKSRRAPEAQPLDVDSLMRTNQSILRYNQERKQRAEIAKKAELMKALEKQAEEELRSKLSALKKRQQIVENMEKMEQRKVNRNLEIREGNRLLSALNRQTQPPQEQLSAVESGVMPHPANSYAFLNMSKIFQRQNKLSKENADLREEVKKLRFVLDQFVEYFEAVAPEQPESQPVAKQPKVERECSAKRRREDLENTIIVKNDGYSFHPLSSVKDRAVAEHNALVSKKLANLQENDVLNASTDYRNHLPKLKVNRSLRPGKGAGV